MSKINISAARRCIFALTAVLSMGNLEAISAASEINARAVSVSPDFSTPGPCSVSTSTATFVLPPNVKGPGKSLPMTLTIPSCPAGKGLSKPYPVLFFYSGFQSRASWYKSLVRKVASWGYVVVQYDTALLGMPTVASELNTFPSMLAWVKRQTAPGKRLAGIANPSAPVVAGHSRGGKLAALVFANNPIVKAAYLIDPIDSSQWAAESPDNPSAAKAIKASGKPLGVEGAGILSSCNPTEGNYEVMFAAAGPGSWMELVPGASHSSFADAGVLNLAQDALCGSGKISRAEVSQLTSTPMLAWFWQQLKDAGVAVGPRVSPMPSFFEWVDREQEAGSIKFKVKPGGKETQAAVDPMKAPEMQNVVLPIMG